jgi:alkylation response protein AidB-like acyl-CoA dehydrogenase
MERNIAVLLGSTYGMVMELVEGLVQREIEPLFRSYPDDRPLPKEAMLRAYRLLGEHGLLGTRLPDWQGGAPGGNVTFGVLCERTPPALGVSLLAHENTIMRIYSGGTTAQRDRFLPDLVTGNRIGASAISEPNVGSDPRGIETTATREGDNYVLNGRKLWVTNGTIADTIIVIASVGRDEQGRNLITRFIVDAKESVFEAREVLSTGLQQGHLGELVFENCRIPADNLLGEPGDAHGSLSRSWLASRAAIGLIAVNIAQRALDASVEYAKHRRQFGRPIGAFQLIQEMLAEMATLVESSRLLCYYALALLDAGVRCYKECSMAKYYATEAAVRVCNTAIQVHGAIGLTQELPLERWMRDARMLTIPDGTTEIQKLIVGRELLGIRAFDQ